MTKNLLFIASLLVFSVAGAQSIRLLNDVGTIVNDDTITFTHYMDTAITQADFKHDEFVAVVNSSATDTMNIDLIRNEIDFISGSADYFCWGTQCLLARLAGTRTQWQAFDPVLTNPQDSAGGSAPLQIYLSPRGNDGVSLFKYTFEDVDDASGNNAASVYAKWVILDTTVYSDPVMLFDIKPRKFSLFGDSISRKTVFNGDTITINSVLNSSSSLTPLFEEELFFNIFNATGEQMDVDMVREEITTIPRSGDYFMWNGTTTSETKAGVSPTTAANNPVSVDPRMVANKDFSIKLFLQADSVGGTAIYKYLFTDPNDPTNTNSFIVKWIVDKVASIQEIERANNFSISPNPAETSANISFENPMNFDRQEVQMFNILGEQVFSSSLQRGAKTFKLNVERFPKGIYFINITANGSRVSSKKMIVK